MAISLTPKRPEAKGRIPDGTLMFLRAQLKGIVHRLVLAELQESGLTRAEIAERIGKDRGQLSRALGAPGNWTLDTVSDLLAAVGKMLEREPSAIEIPYASADTEKSDRQNVYTATPTPPLGVMMESNVDPKYLRMPSNLPSHGPSFELSAAGI